MKSRLSLRVTPLNVRSKLKLRTSSLRSVRSSHTVVSTESYEEESEVVVSTDEATEVTLSRDAATLHELAKHEYKMMRFDEAVDCWNQALQQNPGNLLPHILWNLLKVHLEFNEAKPSKSKEKEVKRYFDKLRPHLSTLTPSEPSPLMLDYFVEQEEWEGAVRLANLIIVDKAIMARIHYERGIQNSASTASRMDCMTKCLSCRPPQRLKLAAHAELVQLHSAAGNYLQALKHHEERLALLEDDMDIAKAFFEEGELYVSLGHTEKAMCSIDKGLELYPKSLTLLEAKADLHCLLGQIDESIELHGEILKQTVDPSEQTKILYAMGRICHKSGLGEKAAVYYTRELEITQETWGKEHLECSRIYHELSRLSDEVCEYESALQYLNEALLIEKLHLSRLKGERRRELHCLIKGTQKLIGKIHFKTGDFHGALQASFGDTPL
jgi:tetratricopeptide (TPR) repeat protein